MDAPSEQTQYARRYLDHLPGRQKIRERIREFLAVETYDSLQKIGNRYFFRKPLPDQEQPSIYLRVGATGEDRLLLDPTQLGTGKYTAVKPLRVSPNGRLLLYEIKQGGERTGTFALLDIETRTTLADVLPRGYLRGFAFASDGKSFYYVHEPLDSKRPFYRAVYCHVLGTEFSEDREIFCAGDNENPRLCLISEGNRLGFLVCRFLRKIQTDFYLRTLENGRSTQTFVASADCILSPRLVSGRILAMALGRFGSGAALNARLRTKERRTSYSSISLHLSSYRNCCGALERETFPRNPQTSHSRP